MAAAWSVPHRQSPVEFRPQEVRQAVEGGLLRYEYLALLRLVHHGDEAYLHGKALGEILTKKMRGYGEHLGVEEGVGLGIGPTVSPLQRLEIFLCHDGDLLAKPHKFAGEIRQGNDHSLVERMAL